MVPEVSNPDSHLADAIFDLYLANRILAHAGGLDAWGHVSSRHPDDPNTFLMSRSRSPMLVDESDIIVHNLDGAAVGDEKRSLYYERFIHAAIYAMKPAVAGIVHSHADDVIPFTVSPEPLRPVMAVAKYIGVELPVWDIDEKFGDDTDLLVSDMEKGRDLAARLGAHDVALMRGHGFVATGPTLLDAVCAAIYLPRNARILMDALRLGPVKGLSPGEVSNRRVFSAEMPGPQRAWEYWAHQVGIDYRPGAFSRSAAVTTDANPSV